MFTNPFPVVMMNFMEGWMTTAYNGAPPKAVGGLKDNKKNGRVPEWFKGTVLKTVVDESSP